MLLEWLYPAALLGLLCVPLLYWLSQQQPKIPPERPFAGVLLLKPPPVTQPPPARSSLWRLLCRAGIVAALLLALAGPHQPAPTLALTPGGTSLVLLDNTLYATTSNAFIKDQLKTLRQTAAEQQHALLVRGLAPNAAGTIPEGDDALAPQPFDSIASTDAGNFAGIFVLSSGLLSAATQARLNALPMPPTLIAAPPLQRPQWQLRSEKAVPLTPKTPATPAPAVIKDSGSIRLQESSPGLWSYLPQKTIQQGRLGLVSDAAPPPLTSLSDAEPYLSAAVGQFGAITRGLPSVLQAEQVSVYIWPDSAVLSAAERETLERAMDGGAVVLRLAGETVLSEQEPLLPLRLRPLVYDASGAYSGLVPGRLASFNADGALAGLEVPPDIVCNRYVLAEPSSTAQIWAQFDNGAPLVSAQARGKGWLVLLHTAAMPSWCSLVYSDVWLSLLERLLHLSQGSGAEPAATTTPLVLSERLDAALQLKPASGAPLRTSFGAAKSAPLSPELPLGRYSAADGSYFWRAGSALLPPVVYVEDDAAAAQQLRPPLEARADYWPYLLLAALALLLIEGGLSRLLLVLLFVLVITSRAEAESGYTLCARDDNAAGGLTQRGIEQLSTSLRQRTNLEPDTPQLWQSAPPVEQLAPCLLVYWRLNGGETYADAQWLGRAVAAGGLMILDGAQPMAAALVTAAGLPSLRRVADDFVVTRTFYRVAPLSGAVPAPLYYSLQGSGKAPQDFAPVFAGSVDLAGAWADADSPAHELGLRSGINLVIYASTGTYKDDAVHRDALFKRWQRDKGAR